MLSIILCRICLVVYCLLPLNGKDSGTGALLLIVLLLLSAVKPDTPRRYAEFISAFCSLPLVCNCKTLQQTLKQVQGD